MKIPVIMSKHLSNYSMPYMVYHSEKKGFVEVVCEAYSQKWQQNISSTYILYFIIVFFGTFSKCLLSSVSFMSPVKQASTVSSLSEVLLQHLGQFQEVSQLKHKLQLLERNLSTTGHWYHTLAISSPTTQDHTVCSTTCPPAQSTILTTLFNLCNLPPSSVYHIHNTVQSL